MDTSQTSDSVANNWSLLTGCCCRPVGAPVGVAPIEPSCHTITCQSCKIVSDGNAPTARGPALLDTKGRAQLFYQGRHEACPPITQQLSGHSEDCYEALIEHLHNCLGHLVLRHYLKGIPHEMVIITRTFLPQGAYSTPAPCWCNRDAPAPVGHTLKSSRGGPLALLPQMLDSMGIPHNGTAILSHHGPPRISLG